MIGRRRLAALAATAPLLTAADEPPPPLSPAQRLLFETPHLAGLHAPLRLDYDFLREEAGRAPVRDTIRLAVRASQDAGRFDVEPEFLTGPRVMHYPVARGFRGNPLLLFTLDRDARELSAATGGSTVWFRTRIRQAFVDAATVQRITLPFEGGEVPATEVLLQPFGGEPRARRYQAMRLRFVLAEAVPGWLRSIGSEVPAGDDHPAFREEIVFAHAEPMEATP
ncbi:hypothetical protein [Roseicella sp. DB1501]|uniref:hypothetical protein n=1 Tax=Roseicella sp. DB1501 TaxID=2730925 RepID=UPI00149252EE|nr:hypothetical protein [Roseicella sp. DB1501]NOG73119.1 hypothetical protein [Roseicella sp. DB1501]